MKLAKVIEAEKEIRPDGNTAYRCVLLSPRDIVADILDGGVLPSNAVVGLAAGDVIAEGSVLITPTSNYIAFTENTFGNIDTLPEWFEQFDNTGGGFQPTPIGGGEQG